MSGTDLGTLLAIVAMLIVAGFLAAAEVGITRMSRVRALTLQEEGRKGATYLVRIVENPARYLNVVLLILLICHVTATTLATGFAIRKSESFGELIATVLMTVVIFVFAEVSPKTFAVQHTDRIALRLAPLIHGLGHAPLLHPLARILIGVANVVIPGRGLKQGPFVTEEELRQMAEVAVEEQQIEEEEKEMIHSIFEFGDTVVREVMVPRPDMIAVEDDTKLKQVLTAMLKHGFSRMPVYKDSIDNIEGIVYAKDVMRRLHNGRARKEPTAGSISRDAFVIPESKKIAELLREMQQRKTHMAIVVDEFGDVAGLVTMEDLLEEIVGEIADEYDRGEPLVEPVDDNTMRVNARMPIDELSELVGVELPDTEWDTVGGLMAGLLGKVPARGEEVKTHGVTFRADKVQGRRIAKVLVTKGPELDGEVEGGS
ncbi:MAG: hemolysin family protein [Actinomycetota bacterium]